MPIVATPSDNYAWITGHCSSLIHCINEAATFNVSSYYHSQTDDESHLFSNEGRFILFTYTTIFSTAIINFEALELKFPRGLTFPLYILPHKISITFTLNHLENPERFTYQQTRRHIKLKNLSKAPLN